MQNRKSKTDHTQGLSFADLSNEIHVYIYSYLTVAELAKVNRVNKRARELTNTDTIWKSKFINHFGEALQNKSAKTQKEAFAKQYECIRPKDLRRFFLCVREKDVASLEKCSPLNWLNGKRNLLDVCDSEGVSLTEHIIQANVQAIYDYFYKGLKSSLLAGIKDKHERELIYWMIMLRQTPTEVESVCANYLLNFDAIYFPDSKDEFQIPHLAARENHVHILNKVSKSIDKPDKNDTTPLMFAAGNGSMDAVIMILRLKEDALNQVDICGITPLMFAAGDGHLPIVKYIIGKKQDLIEKLDEHERNVLMIAAKGGSEEVVDYLHQQSSALIAGTDHNKRNVLMHAVKQGHLNIVKKLLSLDKSLINKEDLYGASALMLALRHHHEKVAHYLLAQRDVNVNLVTRNYTNQNRNGLTALHFAAKSGNDEAVLALLKHNGLFKPAKPININKLSKATKAEVKAFLAKN